MSTITSKEPYYGGTYITYNIQHYTLVVAAATLLGFLNRKLDLLAE